MKEHEIRDLVASNLSVIDPKLLLVSVEHEVILSDGRVSKIDILAKDKFGCFTVIEIKKSDQTARSAVQQLYKYAAFLKRKNRLRVDQIRCIAASTHWRELNAPFSEFKHFSKYESVGLLLSIGTNRDYSVETVDPPFEPGGGDPLPSFLFFEFTSLISRETVFIRFVKMLEWVDKALSSFIVKVDYLGNNQQIIHPFGFAWVVFRGNVVDIEDVSAALKSHESLPPAYFDVSELSKNWSDDSAEAELRDLIITKFPIVLAGEGEIVNLALHSLNNTLQSWSRGETVFQGPIFNSGLFSEDEAIGLACGFAGQHPYNFVTNITPERPSHFNFVRDKMNVFLSANSQWRNGFLVALEALEQQSEASIRIFNPLNFAGLLFDLYKDGKSSRLPKAEMFVKNQDSTIYYFGMLIWSGLVSKISLRDAFKSVYPDERMALFRIVNQQLSEYDEKLFRMFGITHEIFRQIGDNVEWLNLGEAPPRWEVSRKNLSSMGRFPEKYNGLITQAEAFFDQSVV